MYVRIDPLNGPLLGLRIQKDITPQEYQELVDLIERRFVQFGPVRLLVVYEAATGLMGAESLYENLGFAKQVSRKLAKMAVVGKRDWADTWIGLFGLFGGIQASYYDRSQLDAALAWLSE